MAKESVTEQQKAKRIMWKRHLEEWRKSGSTQAEYCRRHSLSTKSFTYWKRRLREKPVTFVPVQVKPEAQITGNNTSGLVLCKDGYRIEIKEGFNPEALGQVLRTIGGISC